MTSRTIFRCASPAFVGTLVFRIRKPASVLRFFAARGNNFSIGGEKNYLHLTDEELMGQCEMDTFKSSGPGGQHRNKRESSVRLKHLPSGIIAQVGGAATISLFLSIFLSLPLVELFRLSKTVPSTRIEHPPWRVYAHCWLLKVRIPSSFFSRYCYRQVLEFQSDC